jgi:hypothetical protein
MCLVSNRLPPSQFRGKTWIFGVQAGIFGALGGVGLVFGPLFLSGLMKKADGQPGTDAGIALLIMSVPFLLVCSLAVFNIKARRRPVLELCREGLQINMIGSSSLDGVPLVPGMIRVVWLILSLQGFKQQIVVAPWDCFQQLQISGLPMARTLTVASALFPFTPESDSPPKPFAFDITFPEVAFDVPLEQIAASIQAYHQSPQLRHFLPSWSQQANSGTVATHI